MRREVDDVDEVGLLEGEAGLLVVEWIRSGSVVIFFVVILVFVVVFVLIIVVLVVIFIVVVEILGTHDRRLGGLLGGVRSGGGLGRRRIVGRGGRRRRRTFARALRWSGAVRWGGRRLGEGEASTIMGPRSASAGGASSDSAKAPNVPTAARTSAVSAAIVILRAFTPQVCSRWMRCR